MKENENQKENKRKITLYFLLVFFVLILYFSYKISINPFIFSQKVLIYFMILGLTIISYVTTIYLYQRKDKKIENIFLVVAIIFCILMYLVMPISKAHDESIHGYRIYEYISGKLINNGKSVTLSEGIIEALENKSFYYNIFFHEKSYSTQTPKINYEYRMAIYPPIAYVPHLIGISVSSIFTTNAMVQIYTARLCNMIACITILYFAIKIIPYGKNMLFLISLIPIAVEGYISLSADGITICSSILLISYILKLRQEKNKIIGYKQITILTILSIVVAISKIVYLPMVLLLVILPKEKFKKNTKWITVFSIFILSAILDILWYYFGMQKDALEGIENIENPATYHIITQPVQYITKIVFTIFTRFSIYLNELFGGKLEYNENISVPIFPYLIFIVTLFITRKKEKKQGFSFSKMEKAVFLIVLFAIVILIFTAMYVGWSRLNIPYIEGVQGRYFLPILPLGILLFAKGFYDNETTAKKITMLITMMQILVISEIFILHI